MIYASFIETPIGEMRCAAENGALIGLWFVGQKHYPHQTDAWHNNRDYPVFSALRRWLVDYFASKRQELDITLAPQGTQFQRTVWDALLEIPYGQVATYGEIARRIGCTSARALGGAVGRNPISILIPCHRVIGANGDITGYAGGIDKKRSLLRIEQAPSPRRK